MKIVFMFPGQSSRYPEMFSKLLSMSPDIAGDILDRASQQLGRDLQHHYTQPCKESMYASNLDVQIGVFLANHIFWKMLEAEGIDGSISLGLSLGEWNHLVHIGALSFEQALPAIVARGEAYDAGPRGAMASFFPVALEELEPIIEQARAHGVLEAVNLNSPRQHVLAGELEALEEAIRLADDELFVQGVIIERQVPMHASLFAPVGQAFRRTLEQLPFGQPRLPYFPNRLAKQLYTADRETFVELLSTHVHQPVLWRDSIDLLVAEHGLSQLALVEVGPKAVLTHLLDRKWHKGIKKYSADSREDTEEHFARLVRELRELPTTVPSPTTLAPAPSSGVEALG